MPRSAIFSRLSFKLDLRQIDFQIGIGKQEFTALKSRSYQLIGISFHFVIGIAGFNHQLYFKLPGSRQRARQNRQ